jgi:hypothetical protein
MELSTFSIPTFRKADIQKRLEKLARKAQKYGNEDITFVFGNTYIETIKTEHGKKEIEYIEVTVSGDAPQIAGWQLLARIELLSGGENLVHQVPGTDIELGDHFRDHNGDCEHCKTSRRRNDVYVLTNSDQQIAVGRSCLRDFLGIDDPKSIVNRAQFFEELKDIQDEDYMDAFSSYGYYDLNTTLLIASGFIRTKGYISKAKQEETGCETTGEAVGYNMSNVSGYEIVSVEDDRTWAKKTIEFFRSSEYFGNNYMDNIRVLLKQDIIKKSHVALVSSAVITAQREIARQQEPKKEMIESNFVGEVKARMRGLDLVLEKIIFLGDSEWGSSYLHLMKDTSGNAFTWITGNKLEVAEGIAVKLDASIKEHKIYNGIKQTVLTRAKLAK